jgi:hypothetical protein
MAQVADKEEIRWLTNEEIELWVQPVLAQRGWALLNISDSQPTCRVLAAFDGPKFISFMVLQLFPVLGPAWADDDHRDGVISRVLADRMHEYLVNVRARGAVTICENLVSARLAERHGMKQITDPVYLWVGKE